MDREGEPLDRERKPLDNKGEAWDTEGEPLDKEGKPLAKVTMITTTGKLSLYTRRMQKHMMVFCKTIPCHFVCSCRWCTDVTGSSCFYYHLHHYLSNKTKEKERSKTAHPR